MTDSRAKAKTPARIGRPPRPIDPLLVERLARIHCTQEEIAAVLGCSVDTLQRRFTAIMDTGRLAGKASLRRVQFKLAESGNATMMIWLGKQYLNQTDRQDYDVTSNGQTIVQLVSAVPRPATNGVPPPNRLRETVGS